MDDLKVVSIGYYHFAMPTLVAKMLMNAHIDGKLRAVEQKHSKDYSSCRYVLSDTTNLQVESGRIYTQQELEDEEKAALEAEAFERAKAERQELLDLRERVKLLEEDANLVRFPVGDNNEQ